MKGSRTNITDTLWRKQLDKGLSSLQRSILWREGAHLLKPSDSLRFESDRYFIDGRVGAILTVMVKEGSNYKLPKAWGVNAIPSVTDSKASVSLITNVGVVPEKEVIDKISEATKSARGSLDEAEESGQLTDASAAQQLADDMSDIAVEIKSGSYMSLSMRLNVIADDEDALDRSLREIEIGYRNWFNKVSLEQYVGQQQDDYKNMFKTPAQQLGYNYKLTSQELAGMSPFITRGLEDDSGIFVGRLAADVNSGAVMLDTQLFDKLAMVGARGDAVVGPNVVHGITKSSLWGVQYAQDALMRGSKVHQVVLNNVDPLKYGTIDLSPISTNIDLSKGKINMLEVFGEKEHELELFSVQIEKLKLIVRQLDPDLTEADLQLLGAVLEEFYIDNENWKANAKNHVDELRLVGIPSYQVPKFEQIAAYFKRAGNEAKSSGDRAKYDDSDLAALKRFERMFNELYSKYGDIFGRTTDLDTASIRRNPQSIYQFGNMRNRGKGAFLAQVINALSYLAGNISRDDVVIVHGAEQITDSMYDYFVQQVNYYWSVGAKVVLLFSTPHDMLSSRLYDDADTTLVGPSTKAEMDLFASKFDNSLPATIRSELSESGVQNEYYFRRGMESALFVWEASL